MDKRPNVQSFVRALPDLLREAWKLFKLHWGVLVLGFFLMEVLGTLLNLSGLLAFLNALLFLGYAKICLAAVRGEEAKHTDLFSYFSRRALVPGIVTFTYASLIGAIFIAAGGLIGFAVGSVVGTEALGLMGFGVAALLISPFMFCSLFVMADGEARSWNAVKCSWKVVGRELHLWAILLFALLLLILPGLGLLLVGIEYGSYFAFALAATYLLVTCPVGSMAVALSYIRSGEGTAVTTAGEVAGNEATDVTVPVPAAALTEAHPHRIQLVVEQGVFALLLIASGAAFVGTNPLERGESPFLCLLGLIIGGILLYKAYKNGPPSELAVDEQLKKLRQRAYRIAAMLAIPVVVVAWFIGLGSSGAFETPQDGSRTQPNRERTSTEMLIAAFEELALAGEDNLDIPTAELIVAELKKMPLGLTPLLDLLESADTDPVTKMLLVITLEDEVSPELVPRLTQLTLAGHETTTRACATHLLGVVDSVEAQERVRLLLQDDEERVRTAAETVLASRVSAN